MRPTGRVLAARMSINLSPPFHVSLCLTTCFRGHGTMSARAAFALSLFLATAAHAFQEEVSSMRVAHLAAQDVVADKWAAASPDAGTLLCATPSRAGHVNKNPNIRHTPFVTPSAEVVKVSKDLRMPLYAGCQVWYRTRTRRARSLYK